MIRVLVADDETLVRAGLCLLLERIPDIAVVAQARDGDEAVAELRAGVDVGLIDVRMPLRTGIEVLETIVAWPQRPPCLLLTTFEDREALLAGIRAGARGYLRKDVTTETLVRAIRAVAGGATFFQPALTEKLLGGARRMASAATPPLIDPLTPRETEVMRLVASGYNNREISEALGTAEGTIKVHVSSILSKLGVRDRVQAVLRALECALL
jgi:DNA-binding NarL/FixJ family response regulator